MALGSLGSIGRGTYHRLRRPGESTLRLAFLASCAARTGPQRVALSWCETCQVWLSSHALGLSTSCPRPCPQPLCPLHGAAPRAWATTPTPRAPAPTSRARLGQRSGEPGWKQACERGPQNRPALPSPHSPNSALEAWPGRPCAQHSGPRRRRWGGGTAPGSRRRPRPRPSPPPAPPHPSIPDPRPVLTD